ncbi:hypothetical protein [Rhodococcus jostii]|uniref:hypothetical protein n=1 Tax=Rhodococcus jostii TaxID=132919 RepID=UPI00362D98B0
MNTIDDRDRIHGAAGDFSDETAREHALVLLGEVDRRLEQARLHRIYYMRLARAYGCSYDQIGAELRITGAAVRAALARAGVVE